jgi:hypothetical protein
LENILHGENHCDHVSNQSTHAYQADSTGDEGVLPGQFANGSV